MWTIFKVSIELVTIVPLFYVFWFLGCEACGISAPQPGIKPAPRALEGEVPTTGLPGKSPELFIFVLICSPFCYLHLPN